jgi:hypothetical protein
MRKKITKYIVLIAPFLMVSAISGCGTMMFLFGDNIRYSLSGKVQDASARDDKGIQGVTVAIDCPGLEKPIYQNTKGVTDVNGNYELTGYWELQGCKIKFTHNKYSPQTIDIDERHLLQSKGFMRAYKVDVRLDSE